MHTAQNIEPVASEPKMYGLLAEFHDVQTLLDAAVALRKAGYKKWDCYTPFPVHGIDKAMGLRPSILPWIKRLPEPWGAYLLFWLWLRCAMRFSTP